MFQDNLMAGQHVLVTGGGTGLGRAMAERLLALGATVDGQTTAHYIAETLEGTGVQVSTLAQGVPVGGELDYLDEGTITAALRARRSV